MMELPEKFTAVDPVSGKTFDVKPNSFAAWPTLSIRHGPSKAYANLSTDKARALIEYGRQMERDAIKAPPYKPECEDCEGAGEVDIERGGFWIECSTCAGTGCANN